MSISHRDSHLFVRVQHSSTSLAQSRLQQLSLPVLLDRLVLRREYCLAIRISQYLKIAEAEGASRIVAHWACYKVRLINICRNACDQV